MPYLIDVINFNNQVNCEYYGSIKNLSCDYQHQTDDVDDNPHCQTTDEDRNKIKSLRFPQELKLSISKGDQFIVEIILQWGYFNEFDHLKDLHRLLYSSVSIKWYIQLVLLYFAEEKNKEEYNNKYEYESQ